MKISSVGPGSHQVPNVLNQSGQIAPSSVATYKMKMNTQATPGFAEQTIQQSQLENVSTNVLNETENRPKEEVRPMSPQLAALAKQRRALQIKERELRAKEQALATSGQDVVSLADLKTKPLKVLLDHGVTYDQLTQEILANQNNAEVAALKQEIAEQKNWVMAQLEEREKQAEQQALAQMRADAMALARQGDEFELVRETRRIPDVVRLIEKTYRQTGEVLDVREALQLVENELLKDAQKMASFNKLKGQFGQEQPPVQTQPMRTLTSKHTAQPLIDRKARALAAFRGML